MTRRVLICAYCGAEFMPSRSDAKCVSELCGLQWSSIAFETATMHVRRAKGGQEATHPLLGDELRARTIKYQDLPRT